MKQIIRNTEVVSISLSPVVRKRLDNLRRKSRQSRSSFIADLISRFELENKWGQIRKWGEDTAKKYKITSEEDIERIIQSS